MVFRHHVLFWFVILQHRSIASADPGKTVPSVLVVFATFAASFKRASRIHLCVIRFRLEPNPNRAYIKEAKEIEDKLNKDMDGYTETPESHPAYQEEWKKFWCAKFKEIQSEGKEDPHKYDYKPEWIVFWNTRVKELFDEDLKSQIKALKSKYGISADEDKVSSLHFDNLRAKITILGYTI